MSGPADTVRLSWHEIGASNPSSGCDGALDAELAAIAFKELTMQTKFDKPIEVSHGKKSADMTRAQKIVFVAKVVSCVATFGFAFPNVQND